MTKKYYYPNGMEIITKDMISDEHPSVFFERMAAKWKCQKCEKEKYLRKLEGDNYICNEPSFEKIKEFGLNLDDPVVLTRDQWDNEWDNQIKNSFNEDKFQCGGEMLRIS